MSLNELSWEMVRLYLSNPIGLILFAFGIIYIIIQIRNFFKK